MPTSTTRYCGVVSSSSKSSALSSTVVVTVNPALGVPTLVLSPSTIDSGQSATVAATVTETGGSPPYGFTLYSGLSNACSADTTVVTVSSGSNPITGLAGTTARFSFAAPTVGTYYCVAVTNSLVATPSLTSTAMKFSINPALTASISSGNLKLDSGQSVILSASASQGTQPYSYQWYSGPACATQINGQTASSYSTGALSSTSTYSVMVGDSSTGAPATGFCAKATVKVNSAFAGTTVTIGPPSFVLDSGQSASLTVSWDGLGTSPYDVRLTTSSSSDCSSPTPTGLNMSGLSATSADFQVSPSSTTFYCAKVTDSATSPESTSTTSAAAITVHPTLAPRVVLSPPAIDTGQTATLTVTVALSGGTSPYTVTLHSGSSASCASDTTVVVSTEQNPQTGLSGPTATFSMAAPSSSTYYCAVVTDSPTVTAAATSSSVQFVVNPALSTTISPASPSVVSGKSVSLTAVPSGGTSPYSYQWYTGLICASGSAISGQTSSTYTASPASTTAYSVRVTDSRAGASAGIACASTTVTVTAALVPTLALSPKGMDAGQSTTVTANVTWSGGSSPYTVTLYSGSSSGCASDTTTVTVSLGSNPQTGLSGPKATFSMPAPSSSTYYCAVVKDSASTPATVPTSTLLFAVNPSLGTVFLVTSPTVLDSGQSTTVTATVTWSGGTSPYTVTLYSGSSSSCSSDTIIVSKTSVAVASATFSSLTSPLSTTYYCATVTDAGAPPLTLPSATSLLTVNPVLSVGTLVISPLAIDSGQSTTVTATVTWSGGTSPYTVTLHSGSSAACASDTTMVAVIFGSNPQTGVTGAPASFTFASPASSTYYCVTVEDASAISVTVPSGTSQFTVNPSLSATLVSLSPSVLDTGQSTTATATVTWSGGTSPYSVALYGGPSASCSLDTTPAGIAKTNLIVTSTTITFTSPTSTAYYCAKVTDSSGTPFTTATSPVLFTVNPPPAVTISPPAPSIGSGQFTTLTALPSGGTPSYTYQWYTGSSCAAAILGQTSAAYMTGVLTTTSTFSVAVKDSSTGSPPSISTACASVKVVVGFGPEGVASNPTTGMVYVADPLSNHISVIDRLSNSVVANITVGSLPWGIAVNSATNVVYVTNYGSGTVTVINGSTNAVIKTITVGTGPEGIAVNPSLGLAYVADSGSDTVSVINTTANAVITSVSVGNTPQSVAIGPSPTYTVFVTNYGSNTVSVMDLSFGVTTVTVGSNPWGVAVNPSTNQVYVTNSGSGTVSVLSGATYATVTTLTVESTPEGIAIDTANSRAYVTNSGSNTVSVINTATNTVITPPITIQFGSNPWGIALLPASNLAYVTNSGSNTVSVINLVTNVVTATIIVS